MSMMPFRQVSLDGPDFGPTERVWTAEVKLGAPFQPAGRGPVVGNHSIRLLAQTADPVDATIIDGTVKTTVAFHHPLLLTAAATSMRVGGIPASIEIRSAAFEPVRLSGDGGLPRYTELHVAPRGLWPDGPFERDGMTGPFEIVAPRLRVTTGNLRVGYGDPARCGWPALATRLSMDWTPLTGSRVRIFGNLQVATVATLDTFGTPAKTARAVAFDLDPEGVEFDVWVPHPFGTSADDLLALRLRLVAVRRLNRTDMRLDLVGGSGPDLRRLYDGLAWMASDLAARGGNVVLQVDARGIPPLSWPLAYDEAKKAYSCGAPGKIPEVVLREDGVGIKVLTRADPGGGELGVAEILRPTATLAERAPAADVKLIVRSVSDQPAPPATGPTATLTWTEPPPSPQPFGNPHRVALEAFAGMAAVDALAESLSRTWAASGTLPEETWPPYAFLALDRGWAQMPLMSAPKPDAPKPGRAATGASAFAGFLRVDVPLRSGAPHAAADGTDLPGLLVVASSFMSVTVTWPHPFARDGTRTVEVTGKDCFGTLDGVIWAGEASPTPVEILPPCDAGPAALRAIPIVFGGRDTTGWAVAVDKLDAGKLPTVTFPLPVTAKADAGPLLVWHPHPDLALVSAVPMTRTAESATRPSATRELVPTQVAATGALKLGFGGGQRLPGVTLPAGTSTHGDGRWRWPWPREVAAEGSSPASPREEAGVALAALTLPGIEFTLGPNAQALSSDAGWLVSLRFDLPVLDELFANEKAPEPSLSRGRKPDAAAPERPPTALDLRRLADVWFENARRLARARTEADRVVLHETGSDASREVRVWHAAAPTAGTVVRGLVEPYAWMPQAFAFDPVPPGQTIHLGAFRLGGPTDWYAGSKALGGLTADFRIPPAGDVLTETGPGDIVHIDGFASSSFRAKPQPSSGLEPDQLHDARGLSLDLDAKALSGTMTARGISLRKAPADQRLSLATLHEPISLAIGGTRLSFWFRDLPLQDNGNLVFDRTGGLETAGGPDPEALGRDRLAKTLYEWRLYQVPHPAAGAGAAPAEAPAGRFEFDLAGPLVARPLRLLAFEMKPDGKPALLEVLASVGLAGPDPTGKMPFGPEDAYASGNLVVLRFDNAEAGVFAFRSIAQVKVGDTPQDPFPASTEALVFRAQAKIAPGPKVPIALGLKLKQKGGGLDIAAAGLTARLFGQACTFDLRDAGFHGRAITASCEGDPGDSPLQLKRIRLEWPKAADPTLTLKDANLRVPLRANDARAPAAFVRDFGTGTISWLGFRSAERLALEEVDHDTGVIRILVAQGLADGELFQGFPLPAGRLTGTIAFVLRRTLSGQVAAWPQAKLGSAFVELAFDAAQPTATHRITAIRHRHVGRSGPGASAPWRSSLRLDASFGPIETSAVDAVLRTSTVGWPVGHAVITQTPFDPAPADTGAWTTTLTMDPAAAINGAPALDLVHEARPRLCAHALPLDLLVQDAPDESIALAAPWRLRAVVEHSLTPKDGQSWPSGVSREPLRWTSIDEISLIDMRALARAAWAELAPATAASAYAFMARYRGSDPDVRIAGVVRRALGNAGFPVRAILAAVKAVYPKIEDVPPALLLTGSSLMEVVTGTERAGLNVSVQTGVTLVPQWILPWAKAATGQPGIKPLDACPQLASDLRRYRIAAHDAAAGVPRRLDGPAPAAIAAQDGTESLVEARLAAVAGSGLRAVAADQAFLDSAGPPANPLAAPLFPRTLLTLREVAAGFARAGYGRGFGRAMRCIVPGQDIPHREIRFTVSAWPRDAVPEEVPAPAVTFLVADEEGVEAEIMPPALAASLADPESDALDIQGAERAEAELRASSLSAAPRIVMLARVDASYLTIRDKRPASTPAGAEMERTSTVDVMSIFPHVDWTYATAAGPGLAGQPAIVLRDRSVTIYASPALGWPAETRSGDLAAMQARLGDEEARRNPDRAWAGRARSLSWPARAWGLDPGTQVDARLREEVERAAFIAMGQRPAFRRRATVNLRSPPDRLAVLAPPRARAPTVGALCRALGEFRIPSLDPTRPEDESRLAPVLPGQVEVTVTGQRPGAMIIQHEGVLLTRQGEPFDPDFDRFGRPAARGPLIARQLRAPRSSRLPDDQGLDIRRRTFVAGDERDAGALKLIKLFKGPAMIARFDRPADGLNPRSVSLAFGSPALGYLNTAWDGRIRLVARVPGDIPARVALAWIGLLPPGQGNVIDPAPYATLQVGTAIATFQRLIWGESIDSQDQPTGVLDARQLVLDFSLTIPALREAVRAKIMVALRDASADTPIRFTVRCGAMIKPGAPAPDPVPAGELALAGEGPIGGSGDDLLPGPPRVLAFDLPHVPARRRWLPLIPFTLAFGDPAYDREIGSPTRSGQLGIGDVPHVLALDRAEYDVGATIHFAFWKQKREKDAKPEPPTGQWSLGVQVVPAAGGPARDLAIAATRAATIRYKLRGCEAYAIDLASLRETSGGVGLNDQPAHLLPGDRLKLSVAEQGQKDFAISVDVGIVAEPVLPPSAASYGLVTLQRGGPAVGTALFATAPLPQTIDFPNLLKDLVDGHVRRRALFMWSFVSLNAPSNMVPFGYLLKFDRSGGGQLPDSWEEFAMIFE